MSTTSWFTVTAPACGVVEIAFQPSSDRYWPSEVIGQQRLPISLLQDQRVVVTGAGAMWMYAHVGAALAGVARSVQVRLQGAHGRSVDLSGSRCRLIPVANSTAALLIVHLSSEPRLADAAIDDLLQPALDQLAEQVPAEICITGQANGRVYLAAAHHAVRAGARRVFCRTPREPVICVHDAMGPGLGRRVDPLPPWLAELTPTPQDPQVIGIIGDPNLGKSVFCHGLNLVREQTGASGWLLDCDGQSPTPPWYLSLLGDSQLASVAGPAREAIKRPWTSEMERGLAEQLREMKGMFQWSIADLPGGDHRTDPPRRIPPGRERIFREVDLFLLLDRPTQSTEAAWRAELAAHGLESRLMAVLQSRQPEAPPKLQLDSVTQDLVRGTVWGLDRRRNISKIAQALQACFGVLRQKQLARKLGG